jgi:uncharacterized protein YbjQ (UPF0145 family)
MSDRILVTTMNDIPGYEVVGVYGEVFGLIARARNVFSNMGAGLRTISGGEVKGYTKLLTDSRDHAVERLREAAAARGANAVIAMRFDCNEIANAISEVAAYGTAVVVRPIGQNQASPPATTQVPQPHAAVQTAPAPAAPAPVAAPPMAPQQAPSQ